MQMHGDGRWSSAKTERGGTIACGSGCWDPAELPRSGAGPWQFVRWADWVAPGPGRWVGEGDGFWTAMGPH
jgi:hypothetical protein